MLLLGFGLIGLLAFHQVGGFDEGFHLRAGNYILDGKGWPRTDPFTYTLNDHPYMDTSWGYQVVLAIAQRACDAPGMVVMNTAIVLGAFFFTVQTARLRPVSWTVLAVLLPAAAIMSQVRFEIRPEVLSYLFLAIVLYLSARHAEGRPTQLWLLPLIFLAWGNCHAFFVLGWAALACYALGLWLRDRRFDRRFALFFALSLATPFINPYGWDGVLFPLKLLTRFKSGNAFAQSIEELLSPLSPKLAAQYAFFPAWPIYAYRLAAAANVISLWPLLRRRAFPAILLCALFLPVSASMTRNMPLLAIACLPATAWGLSAIIEPIRRRLSIRSMRIVRASALATTAFLCVVLILRVITHAYYVDYRQEQQPGWGWNRLSLPVDAAAYIRRTGLPGRMLNDINFGGYLMWAQANPVFIDARLEVVGEQFFQEYARIMASKEALDAAVQKYGIEWIIYSHATNARLTNRLSADPSWLLTYFDHVAAIFLRNRPGAGQFIDASAAALSGPPPAAVPIESLPGLGANPRLTGARRWFEGLLYKQRHPTDEYRRALFHLSRNELAWAEASLTAGIARSEGAYFELYRSLGPILQHTGRESAARRCYQIVLEDRPGDDLALAGLRALAAARSRPRTP